MGEEEIYYADNTESSRYTFVAVVGGLYIKIFNNYCDALFQFVFSQVRYFSGRGWLHLFEDRCE